MVPGFEGLKQADHLERNLLLRCSRHLLPLEGDKNVATVFVGNCIDDMLAKPRR